MIPGSVHSMIIGAQDRQELLLVFKKATDDLVISPTEMFGTIFKGSLTKLMIARILEGESCHVSNFLRFVRDSRNPPLLYKVQACVLIISNLVILSSKPFVIFPMSCCRILSRVLASSKVLSLTSMDGRLNDLKALWKEVCTFGIYLGTASEVMSKSPSLQ